MLVSISCPIPVSTGTGMAATVRAMSSLSNAARSVRAPPPRTTHTTSTPCTASACSAATTDRSASVPCTRASASTTRHARPDASSVCRKSAAAALPRLVTRPTCSGTSGIGNRALRPMTPSSRSRPNNSSRASAMRPNVYAGSIDFIRNDTVPRFAIHVTWARMRTSVPSVMRTAPPARCRMRFTT